MLAVQSSGAGPDLVMLHGWAMHGGVFEALAGRLAPRFRVHLVDLPGHGGSRESGVALAAEAVAAALPPIGPGATWLGWSLGGQLALEIVARHAAAPRALVMLAASPRFLRDHDWPHAVEPSLLAAMHEDLAGDPARVIERFIALEALGSDQAREDARRLREVVFERPLPHPRALREGLELLRDTDLRPRLPGLPCPSLWIAGSRDRLMPPSALVRAASLCPDGRSTTVRGAGHAPFLGHLDETLAAIEAFVAA